MATRPEVITTTLSAGSAWCAMIVPLGKLADLVNGTSCHGRNQILMAPYKIGWISHSS